MLPAKIKIPSGFYPRLRVLCIQARVGKRLAGYKVFKGTVCCQSGLAGEFFRGLAIGRVGRIIARLGYDKLDIGKVVFFKVAGWKKWTNLLQVIEFQRFACLELGLGAPKGFDPTENRFLRRTQCLLICRPSRTNPTTQDNQPQKTLHSSRSLISKIIICPCRPSPLEKRLARLKPEKHPPRGLVGLLGYNHMLVQGMNIAEMPIQGMGGV